MSDGSYNASSTNAISMKQWCLSNSRRLRLIAIPRLIRKSKISWSLQNLSLFYQIKGKPNATKIQIRQQFKPQISESQTTIYSHSSVQDGTSVETLRSRCLLRQIDKQHKQTKTQKNSHSTYLTSFHACSESSFHYTANIQNSEASLMHGQP